MKRKTIAQLRNTSFLSMQALAEGWGLKKKFMHQGIGEKIIPDALHIEKCATGNFETDMEAAAHVVAQAKAGSEYHRRALVCIADSHTKAVEYWLEFLS